MDTHRATVRDATMNTTAALVAEHGLAAVTMSQIAKETGIGRATLYKYFPDVEAILTAWHERQIAAHLDLLAQARDRAETPAQQLSAVLRAYAHISRGHEHEPGRPSAPHASELVALLHRGEHVSHAEEHLRGFLAELIGTAAQQGEIRDDVPPVEAASYCLHALTAAGAAPSPAALDRLVDLTLAALRPADSSSALGSRSATSSGSAAEKS